MTSTHVAPLTDPYLQNVISLGRFFPQEKDTWEDLVLQLILAERLLYAELHSPFLIVCMLFQ